MPIPTIGPAAPDTGFLSLSPEMSGEMVEAGVPTGKGAIAGMARQALSPEAMQAFKEEMYKRYLAKMFASAPGAVNPAPMAATARKLGKAGSKLAGMLPFSLFGGAEDIELPPESGRRDPRLPAEGVLDTLKRSRAVAKKLLGTR